MLFRFIMMISLISILWSRPLFGQNDFEAEIDRLATTMASNLETLGKSKVSVVDFFDLDGNITKFGRFLAEELSASLTIVDDTLSVYERASLQSLIREQKLSTKKIFEPGMAQKIGNLASVEILVTGTYTEQSDRIRILSKMIDTKTGKVKVVRGSMALTPTFQKLLRDGVREGTFSLPTPVDGSAFKPIAEQNKILTEVNKLMNLCDSLKASIGTAL